MTASDRMRRSLQACEAAGHAAHAEGLCRADNPHTGAPPRGPLLITQADRQRLAQAWWCGWDIAEGVAAAGRRDAGGRHLAQDAP